MCNVELFEEVEKAFDADVAQRPIPPTKIMTYCGAAGGIILMLIILFIFLYRRYRKRSANDYESSKISDSNNKYGKFLDVSTSAGTDITELTTLNSSSGGSGALITRGTFSKQCELIRELRNGSRFWLAKRKGDLLAVKIYMPHDYNAFEREIECYSRSILTHDNILRHFGSELTTVRGSTEHWIASEYLPLGSLDEFLSRNAITSIAQLLSLFRAISSGLFHLHTSFFGTQGFYKIGIAHRNLKSRNILMRSPNECCIGDFGLSVLKDRNQHCEPPKSDLIPYPRYMAPEVLEQKIVPDFRSYCFADV